MPKSIPINPAAFAKTGKLDFPDVPIRAYARAFSDERIRRGDEALRHLLHWHAERPNASGVQAAILLVGDSNYLGKF